MLKNYLVTTLRNFLKNKFFSFVNICGLGMSLALGLATIALLGDLRSFDDFHQNAANIYRVDTKADYTGIMKRTEASTTLALTNHLETEFPDVESVAAFRWAYGTPITIGDKNFRLSGFYANEAVFDVFSFPILAGSGTPLSEPNSLAITEATAIKWFGHKDVVGKVVNVPDDGVWKVTALLKDIPEKSHIQFEALVSMHSIKQAQGIGGKALVNDWNDRFENYLYVQFAPNSSIDKAETMLANLGAQNYQDNPDLHISFALEPLGAIATGGIDNNPIGFVFPTSTINFLILLASIVLVCAAFNYTNLTLAKSFGRAKEVGTRKAIGAKSGQLMRQFITESIAMSWLSLGLAFLLFYLLKDQLLELIPTGGALTLDLSWQVIAATFTLATGIGIVSGFFPAFTLARLNTLAILSNNHSSGLFKKQNVRKSLLTLQIVFSIIFINGAFITFSQYQFIQDKDLGYNTDAVYNVNLLGNDFDVFKSAFSAFPEINQISQSEFVTNSGSAAAYYGYYEQPADSTHIFTLGIDTEYLGLHQYRFLSGSDFDKGNQPENSVIVNQRLLEQFQVGTASEAIGKSIHFDQELYQIVGVVEDFHYERLNYEIRPFAFRLTEHQSGYANLKIPAGQFQQLEPELKAKWDELYPGLKFEAVPYSRLLERSNQRLVKMSRIIGGISFMALFISVLGLLGLIAYDAQMRLKEITIRRVLGAEMKNILVLISKSYFLIFLIASAAAIPLSLWYFEENILQGYAYRISMGIPHLAIGTGLLIMIIIPAIIIQSRSVGHKDAVSALRQ